MSQLPINTPRLSPDARTYLQALYLDYFNNYLSAAKFGEHNGLDEYTAKSLIAIAKHVYNSPHPEV